VYGGLNISKPKNFTNLEWSVKRQESYAELDEFMGHLTGQKRYMVQNVKNVGGFDTKKPMT
jgi:hypothetical protein